jgi:phage/plasmid primase-like uncharacterized protein
MVAVARSIRLESEIARRGIKLAPGVAERCGPCPVCGGTDRFSINLKKQVWNCRGCSRGGDVIALVRHLDWLSFKEAVRLLTGHAQPQNPAGGSHGGPGRYKDTGRRLNRRLTIGPLRRRFGARAAIRAERSSSNI